MTEHITTLGTIFSFLGIVATIILTIVVLRLAKAQRSTDERFYRHQTISNIQKVSQHIVKILELSTGEEDKRTPEELENKTLMLKKYAQRNEDLINLLIQDTKFTLSKWMNLKDKERKEINFIIESASWILEKYLPHDKDSPELQKRKWVTGYDELEKRKSTIVESVHYITLNYS